MIDIHLVKSCINSIAVRISNLFQRNITKFGTELKICGFKIYEDNLNKKTGLKQRKILGIGIYKISTFGFFKKIIKEIPKDVDDVYIIRQSTGETYLLSNVINQWIKNNNSKNPYIIYTRNYHKDYFDLFAKNINGKFIPISPCEFPYFNKNKYKYKDKNFYIYMDQKFLYGLLAKMLKNKKLIYCNSIFNYIGVNDYERHFHYPYIDEQSKIYANKIIKDTNFVYICKKSYTILPVVQAFWDRLILRLNEKRINYIINDESITIKQMVAIAEKSRGVISIRTGLTECLTSLHKPMFVLYNKAPRFKANAKEAINLYSLSKYPNVDNKKIFEYNVENMGYDEIIDDILNKLEVC